MLGLGNPELGVLMLALFVVFIMFGFPIAFTLMALGVFFGYFAMGDLIFSLLVQRSYSVMTNDVLISIPLFVFMGYIVERANILDRLFRSLQLAAGPVPASLALATLATCAIFATATGIVGACVTLMGLLAFPAMLRAGYDVKIAAGVVCAGGCLGILIPPSVMLILYGATAGVSVVKLYAGAFFPGIMLAGLYMLYTIIMALLNPKLAPRLPLEERNVPYSARYSGRWSRRSCRSQASSARRSARSSSGSRPHRKPPPWARSGRSCSPSATAPTTRSDATSSWCRSTACLWSHSLLMSSYAA